MPNILTRHTIDRQRRSHVPSGGGSPALTGYDIVSVENGTGGYEGIAIFHTAAPHGLVGSERIIFAGDVATAYVEQLSPNGVGTVDSVHDATSFDVACNYASDQTGTWSLAPSSGDIVGVTNDGHDQALFETSEPHGLIAGNDQVWLGGDVDSMYGGVSGVQVTDTPSPTTFILSLVAFIDTSTGTWNNGR